MKVAVVDVQRAVMQTEDGLRAQAMLKKLFDSRQQELNRKQTELGKQKEEIHTAEAAKETEIGEAAEATVEKIAKHWKKVFTGKKSALNAKRESQLGYLIGKLEKGRADVATMPSAG